MAETPEEPTYQRLGPVNWLPEERKVVERYEADIRELERRLEIAEAKAGYASGSWRPPRPSGPYKLGEALAVEEPGQALLARASASKDRAPKAPIPVSQAVAAANHRPPRSRCRP